MAMRDVPSPSPACGGGSGWGRFFLALALLLSPLFAAATPRIGVMTMQPGEVFWERFGHDAVVVDDPARGEAISYNFGFFDPSEPGFVGNFVAGRMRYALVALPLAQDLSTYRDEGRGVRLQWLDLAPALAQSIADALAHNARPENSRYRYDYFRDNCSTRVRDAIDRGLGGLLHDRLAASSRGDTYRSEATRLASPAHWMWLGFELGLGPNADVPLSRWDESFVPMRLADNLQETRLDNGHPLVASEQQLLPHRIAPEPGDPSNAWWPYALAGLALAAAIVVAGKRRPRMLAAFAIPFNTLLCGLENLLFLWFPVRQTTSNPADIQNTGRMLLLMCGKVVGLGVAGGVAAVAAIAAYFLARNNWSAAFVAGWMGLLAVSFAVVPLIAHAFGRFDVAREMVLGAFDRGIPRGDHGIPGSGGRSVRGSPHRHGAHARPCGRPGIPPGERRAVSDLFAPKSVIQPLSDCGVQNVSTPNKTGHDHLSRIRKLNAAKPGGVRVSFKGERREEIDADFCRRSRQRFSTSAGGLFER